MEKVNKFVKQDMPIAFKEVKVFTHVYFWTIATVIFAVGVVYIIQYILGFHIEIVPNVISPLGGK